MQASLAAKVAEGTWLLSALSSPWPVGKADLQRGVGAADGATD